jgi:hypothetical protein
MTLSINDTQHRRHSAYETLGVMNFQCAELCIFYCYAECHYSQCHYIDILYAECPYAENGTQHNKTVIILGITGIYCYAECHYADWLSLC